MAVIGIIYSGCTFNYDEDGNEVQIDPLDPSYLKYDSVYMYYQGGEKIFNSGNFVKDWYDAKGFYVKELMDNEPYLSGSSTCDHFQSDGAKFDSAYLHMVDGKPVLKYVDTSDPHYLHTQRDIFQNGWEYFVPEGTQPTWEELKEMCK